MDTGLEGKPWYVGLAIGLGIGIAVFLLFNLKLFDSTRQEISKQEAKIRDLEIKVAEGQAAKRNLPQFRDEVALLELELKQLVRILPERKNTPELIRRIRVLTEQAGFQLNVFDPAERETDRGFYKEWPIKIDLRGDYHELAKFFDSISKFRRIINIDNLRISALSSGSHSISANFEAKTFVQEPAPEAEEQGGGT